MALQLSSSPPRRPLPVNLRVRGDKLCRRRSRWLADAARGGARLGGDRLLLTRAYRAWPIHGRRRLPPLQRTDAVVRA